MIGRPVEILIGVCWFSICSGVYGDVIFKDNCYVKERKKSNLFYFYGEFDVSVYGVYVFGEIFYIIFNATDEDDETMPKYLASN